MYSKNTIGSLLNVIEGISHVLLRIDDWSHVRPEVIKHCCELVDAEVCALYLRDEIERKLYLDGGSGYQHAVKEREISYSIGDDPNGTDAEGVTGWVAQTGKTARADSYQEVRKLPRWRGKFDPLLWAKEPQKKFRCMLAVPLQGEGEIIGVLEVENKRPRRGKRNTFDESDERILTALATVIASATQVHRLQGHEGHYYISIYNLLRKGLAIFGGEKPATSENATGRPRILILGSGTVGYLFALLLSAVFKIPRERLCVVGRSDQKLEYFKGFALTYKRGDFLPVSMV